MQFPEVRLIRGARFVEAGNLATSGGLSSGIDLSLRVVERYFGRDVAVQTAYYLEYQGQGWMDPNSIRIYPSRQLSTATHPLCPVCPIEVDPPRRRPQPTVTRRTTSACRLTRRCSIRLRSNSWTATRVRKRCGLTGGQGRNRTTDTLGQGIKAKGVPSLLTPILRVPR